MKKNNVMISKKTFEYLKTQNRSSFAIWGKRNPNNPKAVSDLSVFSDYKSVVSKIKPNIIFVGMNLAKDATLGIEKLGNFHSPNCSHNDYRLRDAITGTIFEGAYMTDLFRPITSVSDDIKKYFSATLEKWRKSSRSLLRNVGWFTLERK